VFGILCGFFVYIIRGNFFFWRNLVFKKLARGRQIEETWTSNRNIFVKEREWNCFMIELTQKEYLIIIK